MNTRTAGRRRPSPSEERSDIPSAPPSIRPMSVLILPRPNSLGQASAIESTARYTCVEAGTKGGKTAGAILWFLRNAWNRPGTTWWWVAPKYRQTRIGYRRINRMLRRADVPIVEHVSELRLGLPNGTTLDFLSGENPDTLYGEDVHGAVIDEASRFREEAYHAIRTTLTATQGPLFIISTPRGKRNWFWQLCQKAKDRTANPDHAYFHWRTEDNPIARADVEDARHNLPGSVFKELYEAEAQEDAAEVFRGIRACVAGGFDPPMIGARQYVAGVDLGRHENYTVVCIMDRMARHVVGWDRFTRIDWNLQKQRIKAKLQEYGAMAYVDATGPQDAVVEDLILMGVPARPFIFTQSTKQQLIEGLAVAIEQRQVTFPDIPELVSELESFGYEVTRTGYHYAAPEGMHDDCVMALAMALQLCGPAGAMAAKAEVVGQRATAEFPF